MRLLHACMCALVAAATRAHVDARLHGAHELLAVPRQAHARNVGFGGMPYVLCYYVLYYV